MWLALDAGTREIVGVYIGTRDETAAQQLWASLPPVYRQCAIAYTDFWAAYAAVFTSKRQQAVDKETGLTSYIERFNNTLQQRVSRLVRRTVVLKLSELFSDRSKISRTTAKEPFYFKGMSTPETPATYAGIPIHQPPQRFTRTRQLELLMWHPLFTGKCPQCGQAIAQTNSSFSAWQCSECGWHDTQPE